MNATPKSTNDLLFWAKKLSFWLATANLQKMSDFGARKSKAKKIKNKQHLIND